jgi:Holliday junction resolvase RusA-like endonuclease
MEFVVTFDEWSRPPLTSNQRLHWRKRAHLTKQVRGATLDLTHQFPAMKRIQVQLTWWVNDNRRRDADNVVPTLKAICDGLVDAGIVPDDTPEFMDKLMPNIQFIDKEIMTARLQLFVKELA